VNFSLSPGQTTQEINVTAELHLVQSTTSDLGHVIESGQIQALPLNGRLFEQLVTIALYEGIFLPCFLYVVEDHGQHDYRPLSLTTTN
jgi:hypothetical protein